LYPPGHRAQGPSGATLRYAVRRWLLLAGYLLLAWVAAVQQWSLHRPDDPYTHYNNYVIFRQAFTHLVHGQDLYVQYLAEHWDYFRYSPSFALAFGLFAWLPDLAGLLLWNTLNAVVLFTALLTLPAARNENHRLTIAAGWFVTIEMMTALQNAQSNVLIAGLLILAFNSLERRQIARGALMIVAAAFIKPFALAAFSLCLFYPAKRRCAAWSAAWTVAVAALPLAAVSPSHLLALYGSWWRLLSMDFGGSTGLSVMGWLETWFHVHPPNAVVDLAGIALFCWPLIHRRRYRDAQYRLLVLCNVLVWVVIFNHKAESSSYIIAMCGAALWFFSQPRTPVNLALVSLAFVFTCLSPTDLFPRSLSAAFFVPYAIKAVPCILIWIKITCDLMSDAVARDAARDQSSSQLFQLSPAGDSRERQ
jgi:hypothetical protein